MTRLFVTIFSMSLRRAFAYRANLVSEFLVTLTAIGASLAVLDIIFSNTGTLGGWSQAEAIALLGTFQMATGILWTFIEPNVAWFRNQVTDGLLDDTLLKPVPSIFLASLGTCAPLWLAHVVTGLAVLVFGTLQFEHAPDITSLLAWLVLFGSGMVIVWASRVFLASLAFWAPSFQPEVLYKAMWEFGRYPVSVYRHPIRFALTWVLPVAAIATIPTRALAEGGSLATIGATLLVALISVVTLLKVWHAGLRRYTSATS
jgi:ABC-2 type transport system permease protein